MYPEIEFSAQLCVPENVKFSSNHIFSQKCNDFSLKIGYTIPCREGGAATVPLHSAGMDLCGTFAQFLHHLFLNF